MSPTVVVAGHTVTDAAVRLRAYATTYPGTILRYDLGSGPDADLDRLSADDVARTRVINSRIGAGQSAEIVRAGAAITPLLADIPHGAHLRAADPEVHGGLYDAALAVFNHLLGPGVRSSKVSKVLHLKRPHLFPILDSRLARVYADAAADAAQRHGVARPGYRRMYWAATRRASGAVGR